MIDDEILRDLKCKIDTVLVNLNDDVKGVLEQYEAATGFNHADPKQDLWVKQVYVCPDCTKGGSFYPVMTPIHCENCQACQRKIPDEILTTGKCLGNIRFGLGANELFCMFTEDGCTYKGWG